MGQFTKAELTQIHRDNVEDLALKLQAELNEIQSNKPKEVEEKQEAPKPKVITRIREVKVEPTAIEAIGLIQNDLDKLQAKILKCEEVIEHNQLLREQKIQEYNELASLVGDIKPIEAIEAPQMAVEPQKRKFKLFGR